MMQKPEYLEWIEIAELDLNSAIFLQSMIPMPVEIICYHCQQSAEKFLKAYLVRNKLRIIRTHDLTILYSKCHSIDSDFNKIMKDCIELTEYSINVRYPYHIELEVIDVEKAILSAQKIKNYILKKLDNRTE
ncbi:MAG TPA: HEPN domain-containing protein [Thermotogota bacterium]|nr:HEPN domain-containing protein [Thermotogota bacterium]HPJ89316.1 HEPN domain-containing protein [Thermotogota bacterium]